LLSAFFRKRVQRYCFFLNWPNFLTKKIKKSLFFCIFGIFLVTLQPFLRIYERILYNFTTYMLQCLYDLRMVWPPQNGGVQMVPIAAHHWRYRFQLGSRVLRILSASACQQDRVCW